MPVQQLLHIQLQVIAVFDQLDIPIRHVLTAEFHAAFLQAVRSVDVWRLGITWTAIRLTRRIVSPPALTNRWSRDYACLSSGMATRSVDHFAVKATSSGNWFIHFRIVRSTEQMCFSSRTGGI